MKRMTWFLAGLLCACACVCAAGGLDKAAVKLSNVSTDETVSAGATAKITGWLERIDAFFSDNTTTVDLDIVASNAYSGAVRTLLSVTGIGTTTATYTPRDSSMDTAGTAVATNQYRFCLLDEAVLVAVTNASATNQDVLVTIIYERP